MNNIYGFGILLLTLTTSYVGAEPIGKIQTEKAHKLKLPPCRACKIFVDSFHKGMERTAKFKFEGGDAAWEEKNLGSYANSEVRFVEVQEKLCSEVVEGKDQCYQLIEEYEETLEAWWKDKQKEEPDLAKYICIDKFKVCCPEKHFGKDCTPCQGYPDQICNKNGKCKGSGTRKGNGKCLCDAGYSGDYCDSCADGFYESYKDENKILCSPCHPSCDGKCSKEGPTGCKSCKNGYLSSKDRGCTDVNECLMGHKCNPTQFCVNSAGSYSCLDCHPSCVGCSGDSPEECIECAPGYRKMDTICVDENEEARKQQISFARYLTYFGLCVSTCIILQKNVSIAAVLGVCVGIYITLSEYFAFSSDFPKDDLKEQLSGKLKQAFGTQ
ncbi:cysteine-rich with EGF-like domain protein 2 isoform X2 [Dendroctonus ponderosae]